MKLAGSEKCHGTARAHLILPIQDKKNSHCLRGTILEIARLIFISERIVLSFFFTAAI